MSTFIDAKFYLEHYIEDTLVSFASERLSKLHEEFSSRIKKSTQSTTYRDESNSALQSSPGVSGVSSQVFPVPSLASQGSGNQSESALSTLIVDEGGQSDFEYDVDTFCDESDGSNQGDGNERQERQDTKLANILHEDISFNNSDKSQNRQNCGCLTEHKQKWVVHNVYKGEVKIPLCDPDTNNADKLRSYRLSVQPSTNFKTRHPTVIEYHGKQYEFDGFSLLSHFSLEQMPECSFIHYKRKHTIDVVPERFPENFVIRDLELFQEFVFQNLLEISDWNIEGKDGGCQMFHILPRFILRRKRAPRSRDVSHERERKYHRTEEDDDTQLLSMRIILDHLVDSSSLLVKPKHLSRSRDEWKDVEASLLESLVLFPGKRPSCIRLDGLLPSFPSGKRIDSSKKTYPDVLHVHGKSPGNSIQQNLYLKLKAKEKHFRNIIECSVLPDKAKLTKLREIERKLEEMRAKRSESSYSRLRINSEGCYKTGLKSDICQHAIIVYAAIDHFRYHKSLGILEDRLNYRFKDRLLLQKALRHVSLRKRLDETCHLCHTLFNCGLSRPLAGDGHVFKGYMRKRGIDNLADTMSKLAESQARPSTINHNESLEFLGDAVLEMITSSRLFYMFGKKAEGELSQLRSVLVGNTHLATIAKRLELVDFMLFGHWNWSEEHMNHTFANCVEAILGAVFIDGGYAEADKLMRNLHFEEPDLRKIWDNIPLHPLQAREPDGDRHLIENSPRLQQIVKLEEQLGFQFRHICILARAFTSSGAADDILTGGNNERLEFLGDTLLKYIISDYVFKHFPDHQEGHLTLLRTSLVNARTQATVLKELGIDGYIDAPENVIETKEIKWKYLANVFEAFIGGIYVDKGIDYCRKICEVTLFPRLENFIINQGWIDPKSQLQICCTYLRTETNKLENPEYTLLDAVGPTSKRIYKAAVSFGNEQIGTGTGTTIRGAEAAAARDALKSNHFDILAKQNRQLDEKFGHKRAKTELSKEEFIDEAASCRVEEEEDWEPEWICEEV